MRIVITTWFLLLAPVLSPLAHAAWDLNDVSYLMPLPSVVGDDQLLGLEAPARGGALLDPQVLKKVPVLTVNRDRIQVMESLRVIAVRIDPCFPLPTPQSCQRQIRLVWQPMELNRHKAVQTIDAALHSFYVLSDQDFAFLLRDLLAWKKKHQPQTQFQPLQVHPAWAIEGDSSPALADFHEIVKTYAGAENLSRVTAMVLRGNDDMWAFVGLDKINGVFQNISIPRIQRASQTFINMAVPQDHFFGGGIAPSPRGEDTMNNLAGESVAIEEGFEEMIRNEVRSAFRAQNPHAFTPENMDCVSCHIAQPVAQWVLNKRPDIDVTALWDSEVYKNAKYDMTNMSPEVWNTHSIRAFGYFKRNLAISQRVINESAEVADAINQLFAAKKARDSKK